MSSCKDFFAYFRICIYGVTRYEECRSDLTFIQKVEDPWNAYFRAVFSP